MMRNLSKNARLSWIGPSRSPAPDAGEKRGLGPERGRMGSEEERDETAAPEDAVEPEEVEEAEADDGEEGPEEDRIPLTVVVEDEAPCRKKLRVEVAPERVSEDIAKGLKDIRSTVPMPGFRKGKVPPSLLARRFGKRVKEEVRGTLVSQAMVQSLEQEKLRPFSLPDFKEEDLEKIEMVEGRPLVFEFSVDVKPDIEVSNYLGIEAERPKVAVERSEVDREVERMRRSRGRVAPVDDGPAQPGDVLVVDKVFTYRKKEVHREENATVVVPAEGSDLLKQIPWLGEFVGKTAGEEVEREFKFPDDFAAEAVRGKKGRQRMLIQDIKRLEPAELDEEFLKELGAESVADLESKIETQLQAAKDSLANQITEDRVVDALLVQIPIELPEGVVAREVDQYMKRYEIRLREQKVPEGEIAEQIEKLRSQRRQAVEKEFRAYFLLEEIARKEKIFITEEEVDRRVEAMAVNYGKWPSQMREELESGGLLDEVRNQLKEEKVKAFLREKAKLTEGPPLGSEPKAPEGDEAAGD